MPAKMLILSPRARSDLDSIYARLKAVSDIATAKRFIAALNDHLERIARTGHSGVPRNKISPDLRLVVHGNYNIYFRATSTETIVARVVHSARDVRRLSFHEDPAPPLPSGSPRPSAAAPATDRARLPLQVLVLPFRRHADGRIEYAIFKRGDFADDCWQGIAGGAEGEETAERAARREMLEEAGIPADAPLLPLDAVASVPASEFAARDRWGLDVYVVTERAFGVGLRDTETIVLSREHSEHRWLPYPEAARLLRWDSNKSALWKLNQRLTRRAPRVVGRNKAIAALRRSTRVACTAVVSVQCASNIAPYAPHHCAGDQPPSHARPLA